jgi:transposase
MSDGVDLSQIEGVGTNTILTLMSEVGFNLKGSFKTAKHFASWLGFTPNRRITGGKTLSSKTVKVKGHLAYAIRQAANTAGNSKGRLGDFFRRLAFRKGRNVAIIATARKIAVIIYKMLETGQEYSYDYFKEEKIRIKRNQIKKILRNMGQFDIKLEELKIA